MMWMPYICVIAFAIAAVAPRYRRTALIMCGAFALDIPLALISEGLHPYLIVTQVAYYDGLTLVLLLLYGSKGAIWQSEVLRIALAVNIICLVDLLTGWDLIHSVYMEAILIVNILAILMMGGAYGDIIRIFRGRMGRYRLRGVIRPTVSVVEHCQVDEGSS